MSNKQEGIPSHRQTSPVALKAREAALNRSLSAWKSANSVNVGHGNFILADRIVAILESGSLPMKRLREKALEENLLVDATAGRKTRSLVITDSRHVILSALAPNTLQERIQEGRVPMSLAQLELEEGEFVS